MRKVIRRRIRYDKDGVQIVGDIDATIATNVSRKGGSTSVSSTSSRQRIVQRGRSQASTEREKEKEEP